jgi:zinc protease
MRCPWALLLTILVGSCARQTLPEPSRPLVSTPDAPFRQVPPPLRPTSDEFGRSLPSVDTATLSNGLLLWVAHRPQLPYVALLLASRDAGTLRGFAPPERIRLTARSLVEGGTVWTDNRVVEPPLINGERIVSWSEPMFSGFGLRVTTGSLENGLTIFGRTLQAPAFGSGNIDDVRVSELKRIQNATNLLSSALFEVTVEAALGEANARELLGTDMDEVRRSGPPWVERCYRELFRPETSALVAVGDVTLAGLLPAVERALGTWQTTAPPPPRASQRDIPKHLSRTRRIHFLPQPDRGQAQVLLLQPAPAAGSADEPGFMLMAELAIGAVSSRANTSLRHEAGITYGVEPRIVNGPNLGLLLVEASFEASETRRALGDLQRMLGELVQVPVSAAELSLAKVALAARLERQTHGNSRLALALARSFAEGKSAAWLGSLAGALAAVTPADVARVARSYLRPEQLEIGVAGPPALANELADLAEVEVYQVRRGGE